MGKTCDECGGPGALPLSGYCVNCISHKKVESVVAVAHEFAVGVLREADQGQVVRQLNADRDRTAAALTAVEGHEPALKAERDAAIAGVRAAEDRQQELQDDKDQCKAALDQAGQDEASPADLRQARNDHRSADENLEAHKPVLAAAWARKEGADTALAQWQPSVGAAKAAADRARKLAENPPEQVPVSVDTAAVAHPYTLLKYLQGNEEAMNAMLGPVMLLADRGGLKAMWFAEGKAAGIAEAAKKAAGKPGITGDGPGNRTIRPPGLIPAQRG
jgi:hypothetical protein